MGQFWQTAQMKALCSICNGWNQTTAVITE